MKRFVVVAAIAAGTSFFLACNQADKVAAPQDQDAGSGSARFVIPTLPAEFLAKTAETSGAYNELILTVNPGGISKIYDLRKVSGQTVLVTGITAGPKRVFYGAIVRRDSIHGDSTTHSGRDTVDIKKDSTSDVHLVLTRFVHTNPGRGSASICLEIEGVKSDSCAKKDTTIDTTHVPPDTSHIPPDTIPHHYPDMTGCYNGKVYKGDSIFTGKVTVLQHDSSLQAVITWPSGKMDTAKGKVTATSQVGFGGAGSQWNLTNGYLDSTNTFFKGIFNDSLRRLSGTLVATRAPCFDTIIPPPPPPPPHHDTTKSCYAVSQTLHNGKGGSGRLALLTIDQQLSGVFRFNGNAAFRVLGNVRDTLPLDTTRFILTGKGPKAMVADTTIPGDTLFYQAVFPIGRKSIASGNISKILGGKSFGIWKGTANACTSADSL